jgi:hypothetical protein
LIRPNVVTPFQSKVVDRVFDKYEDLDLVVTPFQSKVVDRSIVESIDNGMLKLHIKVRLVTLKNRELIVTFELRKPDT